MITYPPLGWEADDLPELLRPAIEKYRDEADEQRGMPPELVDHLRANGAFRLNTPRELGGFELPVARTIDVLERLARIDGPVAWVTWIHNVGVGAGFMPESSVETVWGDGPDPLFAGSTQPGALVSAGDGFRLSGEWRMVSGVDWAEWLGLVAVVMDGAAPRMTATGPDVRFCVVPRSAVTVLDTWRATGMRGTATNTVIARDVALGADMTVAADATPRIDRPLFRFPLASQLIIGSAAVLIGMAQASVDEAVALTQSKTGPNGVPLAHEPRVQAVLGRAAAQVGAARALLATTVGALDDAAASGRTATEAERGAMRGALCYAADAARDVLTATYQVGSSSVLYESSRLGRIFRDGHAAAQHAHLAAANYELVGRTVVGLPANNPTL